MDYLPVIPVNSKMLYIKKFVWFLKKVFKFLEWIPDKPKNQKIATIIANQTHFHPKPRMQNCLFLLQSTIFTGVVFFDTDTFDVNLHTANLIARKSLEFDWLKFALGSELNLWQNRLLNLCHQISEDNLLWKSQGLLPLSSN